MAGLVFGMFLVALGVAFAIVACNDWYGMDDPVAQFTALTFSVINLAAGILLVRYGMERATERERQRRGEPPKPPPGFWR